MEVDVLIVGAGPSGAALACRLADRGISCCLIDKCAFPREKLCGGLVSDKTKQLLHETVPQVALADTGAYEAGEIAFYYGKKRVTETPLTTKFTVVERSKFDHAIVRAFVQKGGRFIESTQVSSIDTDSSLAMLVTGETIRYGALVGADGVYSKVRRLINDRPLDAAFCCETFLPRDAADLGDSISMVFGVMPYGYAWIFPRRDTYAIGLGGLAPKNYNYKEAMDRLLALFDIPTANVPFKGMHVPYGRFVEKPQRGNVLLVGDAAGLVDAMSGEGLYYALYSAKAAADALCDYFATRRPLDSYVQALAPAHAQIRDAARVQRLFYNPYIQKIIFSKAQGRTSFVRYAMENVISKNDMTWGGAFSTYFRKKLFGR